MTLVHLQQHLALVGFDPGALDGVIGPRTKAALRGFQLRAGITADGIPGPESYAALVAAVDKAVAAALVIPDTPCPDDPVEAFLALQVRCYGMRETEGQNCGAFIRAMTAAIGHRPAEGEMWCGLFQMERHHALVQWNGGGDPFPDVWSPSTTTTGAKAAKLGILDKHGHARRGDLLLTPKPEGGYRHVGACKGLYSNGDYCEIAGNTGDAVAERRVPAASRHVIHLS